MSAISPRRDQLWLRVVAVAVVPLVALVSVSLLWTATRSAEADEAQKQRDLATLVLGLTELAQSVRSDGPAALGLILLPEFGLTSFEGYVNRQIEDEAVARADAVSQIDDRAEFLDEYAGEGTWAEIVEGLGRAEAAIRVISLQTWSGGSDVVFTNREGLTGPLAEIEQVADAIEAARDRLVGRADSGQLVDLIVGVADLGSLASTEVLLLLQDLADFEGSADGVAAVRELVARTEERWRSLPSPADDDVRAVLDAVRNGSGEVRWRERRESYLSEGPGAQYGQGDVVATALLMEPRIDSFRVATGRLATRIRSDLDREAANARSEVLALRIGVGSSIAAALVLTGIALRAVKAKARELDDATAMIESSERYARSVIDTATDAIIVVDDDGVIVGTNRALDESVGIDVIGSPIERILTGIDTARTAGLRNVELRLERAEAQPLPVLVSSNGNRLPDGTDVVVMFARDISERKSFEAELEHLAKHDLLTGLPNRGTVLRAIHRARRRAKRIRSHAGVIFIDLDGFKAVNDTRGHQVGDDLLCEIADRLADQVRPYDSVGRLGGDEFVVVLDDVQPDELLNTARRILAELQRPLDLGEEVRIGASIGVALDDGRRERDSDELLREADLAMYRAKRAGRNRIEMFDEDMQVWMQLRSEIESGLRAALAGDHDEQLEMHAQPLVDLATGEIVGVEALARWWRATGPVSPAVFVPIAEEAGLSIDLGRWAIGAACDISNRLSASFPDADLVVSVNMSGGHVASGAAATDLESAIARTGVRPGSLAVELTETQLLDDVDQAVRELERIRALGVAVSIDDFGTGYSSLTYLSRLPATTVKIDRQFVADLDRPDGDASIVRTILDLASSRGLSTVGEGVETAEQADELRRLGCQTAQGYLFQPALPLDEVMDVIRASRHSRIVG